MNAFRLGHAVCSTAVVGMSKRRALIRHWPTQYCQTPGVSMRANTTGHPHPFGKDAAAGKAVKTLNLVVCLVVALAAAACEVSEEQEVAIGQETAQEVAAQIPVVNDPYISAYINEIGDTIASHTSRADLDWNFFVVNSHQVNAFALPGGFIYVNRGLIESATRFDELAGVLGHEIGHVIQRHSVKQMQKQQKVGVVAQLACTLTNICESGLGQAAINIGGTALFARYSRADELQADSEAVENVLRVNIDPDGIPSLFEALMQQRRSEPSIVEGWFSTHPLEESRIENARTLIDNAEADRVAGLLQNLPSFVEFKRRVESLPEPPPPRPPQR